MSSLRLTLSALGAPVSRPLRNLRGHYRVRRGWAGEVMPPDREALPEPFLWGDSDIGRKLVAGDWAALGHSVPLGGRGIWDAPSPIPGSRRSVMLSAGSTISRRSAPAVRGGWRSDGRSTGSTGSGADAAPAGGRNGQASASSAGPRIRGS